MFTLANMSVLGAVCGPKGRYFPLARHWLTGLLADWLTGVARALANSKPKNLQGTNDGSNRVPIRRKEHDIT